MFKSLRNYHLIMIVWLVVEILIGLTYFIVNIETAEQVVTITVILSLVLGNFIIVCLYIFLFSLWIRHRYINTAEIIKLNNAQALTFGSVGMIVLDSDLSIMWVSEFLEDKGLGRLIGKSIVKLSRDLEQLISNNITQITLKIEDMLYDAIYLVQTRTILLQETTKYHFLYNKLQQEKLVFGVISIDNFYNSLQKLRVENQIRVEAFIKTELNDFANNYSGLLLGNIEDGYNILLYQNEFNKARNDNFPLIKNIREGVKKFKADITLSAGFSYGNAISKDLYDLAIESKELAVYRGGDQVVIREFGGNTVFIGGTIEAKQSESKINIRMFAQSLYNEIKLAENILVMGHAAADFDSISSGTAIIEIAKSLNKSAHYVINQNEVDEKTLKILHELVPESYISRNFITGKQALKFLHANTLLIVVDTHNPQRVDSPDLLSKAVKIIVIDHHRVSDESISSTITSYIDAGTSSTAEAMTEIIYYNDFNNIESEFLWNIMFAGILIDTNNFQVRTTRRTFEACGLLTDWGASPSKVKGLLKNSLNELIDKFALISHAQEIKKGFLVAVGDENLEVHTSYLAQISEMLLDLRDCKASFTIAYDRQGRACLSARSNGEINVQIICENLGGGGHFSAAAVQSSKLGIRALYDELVKLIESGVYQSESVTTERY
ncbi:DHH family phosphoesterase [Spiroplasma endosymbiont of Panzeria rudis]|uniref:DHH family phosphoesterase n=1 Tax=Spiroplasma endosymbiont of Panzeria rudis TaxID=3066301 RepID=UPI0030CB578C